MTNNFFLNSDFFERQIHFIKKNISLYDQDMNIIYIQNQYKSANIIMI